MIAALKLKHFIATMLAGACLLQAATALAQTAPARLRGTILKISGDQVDLTLRNGGAASVALAADTRYTAVSRAEFSDIKADSFIGSAAVGQPDGSLEALEVAIFPPGMKPGEGHYPWDLAPGSSMTNGTVGGVVLSNGRTLTVSYPNGEKKIVVPPDAPIVKLAPSGRSLLAPGAHVVFFMKNGADGKPVVGNAAVGTDGLVPPM